MTSQNPDINLAYAPPLTAPTDGRQSATATAIGRGTQRLFASLGFASLPEVTLPNGRRADLVAIGAKGEVWIAEVKSSLADFAADEKWPDYLAYCDRFFFAVTAEFPADVLPDGVGVIVADRFGADVVVDGPTEKIAAARRKTVHTLCARVSSLRLQRLCDPDAVLDHLIQV
ncbi:MAG: MmcB family DNA repair protein [Pseudomonadota bacterium]